MYADLGGLFHAGAGAAALKLATDVAGRFLTPDEMRCLTQATDAVGEVVVAQGHHEGILIFGYGGAFHPSTCLPLLGGRPATVTGASEAYQVGLGDDVVAVLPGVLLFASRGVVEKALEPAAPGAFPRSVSLGPDQFAVWEISSPPVKVTGSITASSERFRIALDADLPKSVGDVVGRQWDALQQEILGFKYPDGQIDQVRKLLAAVTVQRDAGHVSGALDLHEPVADQTRDLGTAAAIATAGVRNYLSEAKMAEARQTVRAIAQSIAAAHEVESVPPKPRPKLASYPAVPKSIPKGQKVQSSAADWKAWAPIKLFQMATPLYYQYEVVASKDGTQADVIARGDLDGDGKASEFKVHLHIEQDPKKSHDKFGGAVVIEEGVKETNAGD
jgi:hypothetical protein